MKSENYFRKSFTLAVCTIHFSLTVVVVFVFLSASWRINR